jgi:hypothetical protein
MPHASLCASIWLEVRGIKPKRPHIAGLSCALLFFALVIASAQAGAANPQPNKVQQTASGIRTLALAWPRVAYASGGRIHVWNVATGKTVAVKGNYSNSAHTIDAAQVAIAGKRVAWIKRVGYGNTEEGEKLYSASIAGRAHVRKQGYIFGREDSANAVGGWIAGVVGSGNVLAVSTWKSDRGSTSNAKLSRITPTGLRTIVTGPGAVVAQSANGGHIAVLRSIAAWPADEPSTPTTQPSVGVYSTRGKLLREIVLSTPIPPPPSCGDCVGYPSTIFNSVALSGDRLVVLTETNPWTGPSTWTTKIELYDWTSGALLQSWPLAFKPYANNAAAPLAVHGRFAAVVGKRVHVIDLTTGKEIMETPSCGSPAALDSHGLVYAASRGRGGKVVFVPMAKLLAALTK